MKQIPKRVMIVSFDAVGAKDLEYLQTLPNFRRFFEQAALCSHVNSVCPSLTYPAHTSIVTGRMPKNHGIVNNTKIQPNRKDPDWLYHRKWIRSTTLYDEAKKKGMTTAGLLWPVAAGSRMDYYVPEIMVTRKWQNQILMNATNGPLFYQLDLNKRFGHLRNGIAQPQLDNFIQACALDTIYKYNPQLFLLHLTDVDTNRHLYGVESKEAKEALKRHDKRLGEIVRALEETGEMESTTVVLLGDHYQKDVDKVAFVNHALWKAGLLTVRNGKIKSWKAYAKNCDGSCYICLHPSVRNNAEVQRRTRKVLETLKEREDFGIERILTREEAANMGADENCFLMLEAKEGWFFLDEWEQLTAAEKDCAHGMKGTHGYLPGEADYQTFFAMSGCSVRAGARVEKNIALWDEGATLAALLEIDLGKTDGSVIREMLQ